MLVNHQVDITGVQSLEDLQIAADHISALADASGCDTPEVNVVLGEDRGRVRAHWNVDPHDGQDVVDGAPA